MNDEHKPAYDIQAVLLEMREKYWQGLAESEEAPEEQLECLTFDLGGETYAFETVNAAEVIRIPRLVKIPKVQDHFIGVFNLRGVITAAVDIRPLLRLPQLPLSASARIVVVKSEGFLTGLLTETVREVAGLSPSSIEHAVPSLSGEQREFIRGQLSLNGKMVMLLDIKKLMASPELRV